MKKEITIYSTNTCAYCKLVKKFLDLKGHSYKEINLDEEPDERVTAYNLSGALTVPITRILGDSGDNIVVGWNPGKLVAALA